MSKGARKTRLRDYSRLVLSSEEKNRIVEAAIGSEQHSIVTAILGYVLVEHELDRLLRRRFKRNDDETWEALLDERGPLRSFYTKIETAYAFAIIGDKIRKDLHVIRSIRNAFAHAKKLLDFDDELVISELLRANHLRVERKKDLQKSGSTDARIGKVNFINVCLRLSIRLLDKHTRALTAATRRKMKGSLRKSKVSPLANALVAYADLQLPVLGLSRPHSSENQSGNPRPLPPLGSLGETLQALSKLDDKRDK